MGLWDIALVILSYLIGSISPGILLGRRLKGIDIRNHGSGNTGATNVLRILGPGAAALAFLVDAVKGAVAVWLGSQTGSPVMPLLCGGAAIVGHNWPIYVGFRGGKGMATAAGIVFSLYPFVGLQLLGVFVAVAAATRYVSLASVVSTVLVIPALALSGYPMGDIVFASSLAALIVWRHRANIERLLQGRESKIGRKAE